MADQLSLLGLDAEPTDRLLFALFPDADTAAAIENQARNLRREHGLRGVPLAPDRLHLTLHHIGDYAGLPQGVVAAACDAAASIGAAPFEVAFDRAGSFAGRSGARPFVLRGGEGLGALMAFWKIFGFAMARGKVGRRMASQYTPHVTLLYDDKEIAEQPIEPIRWVAREFVLIHSLLGQTRHIPLGRWTLKD